MAVTRHEILPGVWLSYCYADRFKTSYMSLHLITQLRRETAALNGILPNVLYRGTALYPDMEKLSARMEELYGASITPSVRQLGELQCIGFGAGFPEEGFLPAGADEFRQTAALLTDLLLHPATKGGLLQQPYVESEKQKLSEMLQSIVNDKRAYSFMRCREEMCCFEDYAAGRFGKAEDVDNIHYKKLTRQYRHLLETCPVEVFYCGRENEKTVLSVLKDCLSTMPRGEIDYDIGTDIRLNAIEAQPRFYQESMPVTQARLVIGWRIGESIDWENRSPITVFNALFGASAVSKLFLHIREKLGLCYEIASSADLRKGLLFVTAGIDAEKAETVKNEIFSQLEMISRGCFTAEELEAARAICIGDTLSINDSQRALASFSLVRALEGTDFTPEDSAQMLREVTKEDIMAVASGVECDMIYLLSGNDDRDDSEEDGAEQLQDISEGEDSLTDDQEL